MKLKPKTSMQIIACAAVLILLGAAFTHFFFVKNPVERASQAAFPPALTLDPKQLQAEAAIVYDPVSGRVLFAKNEQEQLPLASLTKLMTADTALNTLSATSSVHISMQDIRTEGDSGLKPGEVWPLGEIIRYALLVSSNDGMAAVAENAGGPVFIQKMNNTAQSLGLAQSYFLNPTGLDLTTAVSGAYGSARDLALLATAFYQAHPAYFESSLRSGATYGSGADAVSGKGTAVPILDIPGLVGAKTGYTDLADGNVVAIFDIGLNHPITAVVLHSTYDGRFSDIRTLIDATRAAANAAIASSSAMTPSSQPAPAPPSPTI